MKTREALDFPLFGGSQTALARWLSISQSNVSAWGEYPPPLRQFQIEALTAGKLVAEPACRPWTLNQQASR